MGEISKRLHRKLASKGLGLPTKAPKRRPGEPLPGNVKDVQMLINDGYDPVHAAYVYIQQISSMFAEGASEQRDDANHKFVRSLKYRDYGFDAEDDGRYTASK